MNNPFQFLGAIKNPQQLMQQMTENSQIMQNPMMQNAIQMYHSGNTDGLKKMAENVCREKGINPEEALRQIKSQFGM